ncbi:MAG: riboflavin biosynthesis protein RibF [bacterium]
MNKKNTVITIGTFDGVHRGHKKIIRKLVGKSKKYKIEPVVLALKRPARSVIKNDLHNIITPWKEKVDRLKRLGVKEVEKIQFKPYFQKLSPTDFFKSFLLKKFNIKGIVVGEDFRFGFGRKGDVHYLKKLCVKNNIKLWIVKKEKIKSTKISSSLIRGELRKGNLSKANLLLGYKYLLYGKIYKGFGVGREIGIPTLNVKVEKDKILPPGVHFCAVIRNKKHLPAVCSIGYNPTVVKNSTEKIIEVHLLNFIKKLNWSELEFELISKIREEINFKSLDELKQQIELDILEVRRRFNV